MRSRFSSPYVLFSERKFIKKINLLGAKIHGAIVAVQWVELEGWVVLGVPLVVLMAQVLLKKTEDFIKVFVKDLVDAGPALDQIPEDFIGIEFVSLKVEIVGDLLNEVAKSVRCIIVAVEEF